MKFSLKLMVLILCALLVLQLSACSSNKDKEKEDKSTESIESSATDESDNQEQLDQEEEQQSVIERDPEKAKELNTQGYRLYKQGKYKEALVLFKKSFQADDEYLFGHYNYACTLGILIGQDSEQWGSYKEDAIEHIKKVIQIKPEYVEKIKTDTDLDSIRSELEY